MKLFCETSSLFELDIIKNAAILRDFLNLFTWQRQKRSNSARLPQSFHLTASKTKQFCETSSIFEVDNIKHKAILRDFLRKWKVECRADGLVPMRFAISPLHLSKVLCLPQKKWGQVIRSAASAAPITQNHLTKPEDLMLQNATLLRSSAPGPPNISDEHVSCTAPATKMHLSISSSNVPRLPTLLNCYLLQNPWQGAHFWQGAQSLAPSMQNDIWRSKSFPNMWCFWHFDLEMCFALQRRALFRHLNFQKWSEREMLSTIWFPNVLHAARRAMFSSLIWSDGSAPFSEPTFWPSGATNHWKNIVFHDFSTFSRTCMFFLLVLSLLWSSLFFSSLLWLFPPLLFHMSVLSEVWLLNFFGIYNN